MSRNFYSKNKDIDYHKSLNRIMVLGLTGMATLGASMLIAEANRSEASPLKAATSLLAKNVLRLPGVKPSTPTTGRLNITKLNMVRTLSVKRSLSTGSLLSSIQKLNLGSNPSMGSTLTPSKSPLIVKSNPPSLSPTLKPKK